MGKEALVGGIRGIKEAIIITTTRRVALQTSVCTSNERKGEKEAGEQAFLYSLSANYKFLPLLASPSAPTGRQLCGHLLRY